MRAARGAKRTVCSTRARGKAARMNGKSCAIGVSSTASKGSSNRTKSTAAYSDGSTLASRASVCHLCVE